MSFNTISSAHFCRGQALDAKWHCFFCGLELLLLSSKHFDCYFLCFNALIGLSCYDVTRRGSVTPQRFNALMGLSCYLIIMTKFLRSICFNALTGLSCYIRRRTMNESVNVFQCPHGLELLLKFPTKTLLEICVSMPSRA